MMYNSQNSYVNNQKIKFLEIQRIATIGFIIALVISYSLTYDKELTLKNNKGIFKNDTAQNLALFQNILILIISFIFLYINHNQYKLAKIVNDSDSTDLFLQVETALFGIISSLIGLYIVYKNYKRNFLAISETELF